MNLKRLELMGFKSFAKKTVLDFEAPIIAVVGPNGSGKSNVAEAFRWALGEQSMKSLRGKRGEDLIFNGSAGYSRMNHASVDVVFDNKARKFNLDFDEVIISRHIYRDNTNEYFINGTKVRLKDIIELLSVVSLGVSSHHIISQGEADRILNANMFERREMIEDALGLKIFQYKKEESERKLEKTKENIKEVESLRREIAPHLKFLRKQVEQVKKAEEMRNDLVSLYKEYFKKEENYLKNFKETILKEKSEPELKLKKIEEEISRISSILSSANTADPAEMTKLRELENGIFDIRNKKNGIERDIGRYDALIEVKSGNLISEKETKINSSGQKICSYCGQAIPQKTSEVNEEEIRVHRQKEVDELKEKRALAEKMLASLNESEKTVVGEIEDLKIKIESRKDEFRDSERLLYEFRAEKSSLLSQLSLIRTREEKLAMEESAFKMELTEAGVLAGRTAIDYKDFVLSDGSESLPRIIQEEMRKRIERIKIRLEDMGNIGSEVMKEYQDTEERDKFLEREVGDLLKSAEDLKTLMDDLAQKIDVEFKKGVEKINKYFQEFFTLMFGGGDASLLIVVPQKKKKETDSLIEIAAQTVGEDEKIEEGVDISVSLPRKKVKGLTMLSGGERALTSIALLFAMSQVNPPPFLILDETDAALDESNSRKYGDMIENLSKLSQLIVITHNRETMSRAGILYGVTMGGDGVSKLLSIKFDEAVAIAK